MSDFQKQVWALIQKRGPITTGDIAERLDCDPEEVDKAIAQIRKVRVMRTGTLSELARKVK